jgi:hypothetical protein
LAGVAHDLKPTVDQGSAFSQFNSGIGSPENEGSPTDPKGAIHYLLLNAITGIVCMRVKAFQ